MDIGVVMLGAMIFCYIYYAFLSTGTHIGNHAIANKKTSLHNETHATYRGIPYTWKFLLMYAGNSAFGLLYSHIF